MVIGLLGILKAGGAYLPLDPDYPARTPRLHAGRCRARCVVTQAALLDQLPTRGARIVQLDADRPRSPASPRLRRRSIYARQPRLCHLHLGLDRTPKGVAFQHGGLLNHMFGSTGRIISLRRTALLNRLSSFDVSIFGNLLRPLAARRSSVYRPPPSDFASESLVELIASSMQSRRCS